MKIQQGQYVKAFCGTIGDCQGAPKYNNKISSRAEKRKSKTIRKLTLFCHVGQKLSALHHHLFNLRVLSQQSSPEDHHFWRIFKSQELKISWTGLFHQDSKVIFSLILNHFQKFILQFVSFYLCLKNAVLSQLKFEVPNKLFLFLL